MPEHTSGIASGPRWTVRLQEAPSGPTSRSLRCGNLCPQPEQLAVFSLLVDSCAGCAIMDLAIGLPPCGPGPGELWRLRWGHFFYQHLQCTISYPYRHHVVLQYLQHVSYSRGDRRGEAEGIKGSAGSVTKGAGERSGRRTQHHISDRARTGERSAEDGSAPCKSSRRRPPRADKEERKRCLAPMDTAPSG